MQLVFDDRQKRTIKGKEEIKFSSFSAHHLIIVTTQAKSEKQLGKEATDDEDLTVRIDNKTFPKPGSDRLKDSPAAFSGGRLHNLSKTVYFLVFLKGSNHTITLKTDEKPNTATFENLQVYAFDLLEQTLPLEINSQAEDGDRRPWITIVLDDLPLESVTPTITFSRRKWDSDDVKIIIDGKTQGNILRKMKHFLWRFVGSRLPWSSPTKTKSEAFEVNLSKGLHYLEFEADRMPILNKIIINFGGKPSPPIRTPTANSPKWTGSFYDDTELMLLTRIIFGEARNQPRETKIGVGWAIRNRIGKGELIHPRKVYKTYHDVILDENQYASLTDPRVRPRLEDPLNTYDPGEKKAWHESYEVAYEVLTSKASDPTEGALFFHDDSITQEEFLESVPRALYIKTIGNMLFYGVKL